MHENPLTQFQRRIATDLSCALIRSAQNDASVWIVILNPSALLRINSVKDLLFKMSQHYVQTAGLDEALTFLHPIKSG
jgi:hypothetical protein